MKRLILMAVLAIVSASGCGDDKKATPPAGPMQPPGPGAEKEGRSGKGQKANTVSEG